MLLGFSILTGNSLFESLMILYIFAIIFIFFAVTVVDAHVTSHTTKYSIFSGSFAAVLVMLAGGIVIPIYTSYNSSYKKDSLDYWRQQTTELIEKYEETNDEIESNYILRFKALPAYKKFDHYHLSLFGISSKEFTKYFERKISSKNNTAYYMIVEQEKNVE